jgi:AcrR family transcriptional regulator
MASRPPASGGHRSSQHIPGNPSHLPDPTEVSGSELGKSRETRRRILEAARDVLAAQGYQRFSTILVAEQAGLTRPAMLYHFRSRADLLRATAQYLVRTMVLAIESVMTSPEPGGVSGHAAMAMVDMLWEQRQGPEYAATVELLIAARTDPGLKDLIRPAIDTFDRNRLDIARRVLPGDRPDTAAFEFTRDLMRFMMDGMALRDWLTVDMEGRLQAARDFLKALVGSEQGRSFIASIIAGRRKAATGSGVGD